MTTKEYAKLRGVSPASVRVAIQRAAEQGKTANLPGVKKYKKLSRDWDFTIDKKYFAENLEVT